MEQFQSVVILPCYYCGLTGENKTAGGSKFTNKFCGIDRVDSNLGYVLENIVSCCEMCNRMKMRSTKEQLFIKIKAIYEKHNLSELKNKFDNYGYYV